MKLHTILLGTISTWSYSYAMTTSMEARELLPKPHKGGGGGGGGSNSTDCRDLSCDELNSAWFWGGTRAKCKGGKCDGYNNSTSTSTSSSSSNDGGNSDFDLSTCTDYSNAWLWELTLSCDPDNLDSLLNCQCPTAEALLASGEISCAKKPTDKNACPADCEVCKTCMVIIGCDDIYDLKTVALSAAAKFGLATVVLSSVGVSAALAAKFFSEKNERKTMGIASNLPEHLMGQNKTSAGIEMATAHRIFRQANAVEAQEDGVWLAPLS